MKKSIITLALTFCIAAAAQAQTIVTVDLSEIYSNYYRAEEAQAKFGSSFENAQEQIRSMVEEGRSITQEYQKLSAKAKNPALTESAQQQAGAEAEELLQQIRKKEDELNSFRQRTEQDLAKRRQNILKVHFNEIKDVINDLAEKKGAQIVLNTSSPGVVYSQESLDMTQEVLNILNADAPQE